MKTILKPSFLLIIFILCTTSCKKKSPAPDYPEFMGTWSGSTSQSQIIRISVDNISGTLYVTSIKVILFFDSGGQQTIEQYNTQGLAAVTNRYFKLSLGTGVYGPAYIDGTFDLTTMTVTGTFKAYNPSNPNDFTSGTFVGSKIS